MLARVVREVGGSFYRDVLLFTTFPQPFALSCCHSDYRLQLLSLAKVYCLGGSGSPVAEVTSDCSGKNP